MHSDREMALVNQTWWASINYSAKIRATWTKEQRKNVGDGKSTAVLSGGEIGWRIIAQELARFADPKLWRFVKMAEVRQAVSNGQTGSFVVTKSMEVSWQITAQKLARFAVNLSCDAFYNFRQIRVFRLVHYPIFVYYYTNFGSITWYQYLSAV